MALTMCTCVCVHGRVAAWWPGDYGYLSPHVTALCVEKKYKKEAQVCACHKVCVSSSSWAKPTWRLMKNGLAVGTKLQHRRIKGGMFCAACGRDEMLLHRFWSCPYSHLVWKHVCQSSGTSLAEPPPLVCNHRELAAWLREWLVQAKDDEKAVMMQMLFQLWLVRNEVKDGGRICEAPLVAEKVSFYVMEWQDSQSSEQAASRVEQMRSLANLG